MWDCIACGVRAIAASLHRCPKCRKEREMPKTTSAGGTNGPGPDDAEPAAVPAPAPAAGKPVAKAARPAEASTAPQVRRAARAEVKPAAKEPAEGAAAPVWPGGG